MKQKSSLRTRLLCLCMGMVLVLAMVFSACEKNEPAPTPTATLTLSKTSAEVTVEESTSFTYTLTNSTDTVTFSENDSTLASYTDNSGTVSVTAKAVGTYVLTVKAGTLEKAFTLTIKEKSTEPENPEEPEEPEDSFSVSYRSDYTPTYFSANVTNTNTKLADGVYLVKNSVTLKNGNVAYVYTVEVDLNKASIQAGTKNNASSGFTFTKDVPYAHAEAWENATGGQVYASLNADFFGTTCVNAFVKDGFIVKDGHNDNGNYDYTNSSSDVPASAPMLFGIKNGTTAQIAPIISYEGDITTPEVKQGVVQAKLTYVMKVDGENDSVALTANPTSVTGNTYAFTTSKTYTRTNGAYVKVDISNGLKNMKVLEAQTITKSTKLAPESGKTAYIVVAKTNTAGMSLLEGITEFNTISVEVSSPDGAWDGYDTILGCRQALVINNEIASTVTLENTNGAQTTDIPRSAVGIKPDGTVVLFAVEAMRYYNLSTDDSDGYGMNLPELAEFAYYYGCSDAANFDGGGSTQLVTRADGEETAHVVVRSADKGLDDNTDIYTTRVVMNSILVTTKED